MLMLFSVKRKAAQAPCFDVTLCLLNVINECCTFTTLTLSTTWVCNYFRLQLLSFHGPLAAIGDNLDVLNDNKSCDVMIR